VSAGFGPAAEAGTERPGAKLAAISRGETGLEAGLHAYEGEMLRREVARRREYARTFLTTLAHSPAAGMTLPYFA
jgi:hypothetical protein